MPTLDWAERFVTRRTAARSIKLEKDLFIVYL
jgi:hypothetical protein